MESNGEKIEHDLLHETAKRIKDYCRKHSDCTDGCYFFGETGCRLRLFPFEWLEDAHD